jgi:hypothetical protein
MYSVYLSIFYWVGWDDTCFLVFFIILSLLVVYGLLSVRNISLVLLFLFILVDWIFGSLMKWDRGEVLLIDNKLIILGDALLECYCILLLIRSKTSLMLWLSSFFLFSLSSLLMSGYLFILFFDFKSIID